MNLSKDVKITVVAPLATAAQTAVDSSILDMQGYEGVMFIAMLGAATATAVLTLTVKGNTANSLTVPAPVTQKATAAYTAAGTASDSKAIMVDLYKPAMRYVFAEYTRTVANAALGGIIAIQYNGTNKPTANDASIIAEAFGLGVVA